MAKIDPDIELGKELLKSFVGFNKEKNTVILKLEIATQEVRDRHKKIISLHKSGKLKGILAKIGK
jgi:hypothetical protein